MADYIFCMRKKNNPRIDVRICQKKCPFKDECPEFLDYQRNSTDQSSILNSRLIISPLLNPMASKNWRRPYSRQFTPLECSLGNTGMVLKYYQLFHTGHNVQSEISNGVYKGAYCIDVYLFHIIEHFFHLHPGHTINRPNNELLHRNISPFGQRIIPINRDERLPLFYYVIYKRC